MVLLAKAALGVGGALVLAGAYTFHQGLIRVDVDEYRTGGSHVHMWVPAAIVPMGLHLVPKRHLRTAADQGREILPLTRILFKELKKFPNAEFVEFREAGQHVQVATRAGKLEIEVREPDQHVHLLVPLSTLDDVVAQIEASAPGA